MRNGELFHESLIIDFKLLAVHGVPGVVGALAIGFFATVNVNPDGANGVFYGGGRQLWVQLVGVLVTVIWTIMVTLPLIWLFRKMDWFSLQPQHEALGLDGKDHVSNAYQSLERDVNEESSHVQGAYTRTTRQLLPHPRSNVGNDDIDEEEEGEDGLIQVEKSSE